MAQPYDVIGAIEAYEFGLLDDDETVILFQSLIDSGLAWQLQGSYGRTAVALIEDGLCGASVVAHGKEL